MGELSDSAESPPLLLIVYYQTAYSFKVRNKLQIGNRIMIGYNELGASELFECYGRGDSEIGITKISLALQQMYYKLTPENQKTLNRFATARNRWLLHQLVGQMRSGVHRQTLLGNLGLIAAAIFRKI